MIIFKLFYDKFPYNQEPNPDSNTAPDPCFYFGSGSTVLHICVLFDLISAWV